jgi:aldehyde:ferredoxin oxidoreductase
MKKEKSNYSIQAVEYALDVLEQKLLDSYYEFKGWNNDGIPTKETLLGLGLDYVCEDFVQRGILTDN